MPAKPAVVISIYDEAETLPELFSRLRRGLDGDLQDPPELIEELVASWKSASNRDKSQSLCIGPGYRFSQKRTAYVAC